MIKVDLKKAYDSVEWGFLESVLSELGFPSLFIKWILGCITSVSFSILINGAPSKPFKAKKGLRQGDPLSPFLGDLTSLKLLMQAFMKFSHASGLSANLDKSETFFGGVSDDENALFLQVLGMSAGCIPFRYLGVPLSSKKLSVLQCKPLVAKITSRVDSWAWLAAFAVSVVAGRFLFCLLFGCSLDFLTIADTWWVTGLLLLCYLLSVALLPASFCCSVVYSKR
ncbi:uncharacterized protein LOC110708209 [Chenopodium quinoa]|uniref:uncharacterized protein LOC110708209 n=1 Tax=Chenopodium quinoa TaxID=63459 RepID=UPI000B788913|nr:uncharacterized protein LOC110708209 [Chenopodium quinoa]